MEGGVLAAGPVTALLERNSSPEALLRTVLSDFEVEILETAPIAYRCRCTRDRVERALISMGVEELENLLEEQGGCELTCQFCDQIYRFTRADLEALLTEMRAQRGSQE